MRITLEKERPISWNLLYAGSHWGRRQEEAQRVHQLVAAKLHEWFLVHKPELAQPPVDVIITVYFEKRPLDADNIAAKMYVDALKGLLVVDDSPKYVRSVTTVSLIDKDRPRVEIEVVEAHDRA